MKSDGPKKKEGEDRVSARMRKQIECTRSRTSSFLIPGADKSCNYIYELVSVVGKI
jgi:hypothetical protein